MANLKYNKATTEKLAIKGLLSNDGTMIEYENADKEIVNISVDKCFKAFAGQPIAFTLQLKADEDLTEQFEKE
jgi:hypothetical protein